MKRHCCSDTKRPDVSASDPCAVPEVASCGAPKQVPGGPLAHFRSMIANCLKHAQEQHAAGRHIVGIMCEYTPRELIMAAGAVPVCLCGGSAATIPAAEEELPSNLCPLIKSTYGYHVQRANPFLEMADLLVAETTCDGKKKMFELMAQKRPMYVLELPQRQADTAALSHWEDELRRFKTELESRFAVKITDEMLRDTIALMNRERSLRREVASCMKTSPPPVTGRQLVEIKSSIPCIPADLDQYEKILNMFRDKGGDPALARRVRVLMTGVPTVHGAERVIEIVEDNGGVVVCMENCTGIKPLLEDVDAQTADPIRALAEKYYHLPCSVMTVNDARMSSLSALAGEYAAQCVIELVWQACLTYDVESARVRRLVEDQLALPYLRIETDYSPSDSARIAVRVEALFETVRNSPRRGASVAAT